MAGRRRRASGRKRFRRRGRLRRPSSPVVDHRDPEDAQAGRPLSGAGGAPIPLQEELVHPLEVLRAFADNSTLWTPGNFPCRRCSAAVCR
ncbi:hypothetical protein GCM10022295_03180 [Streptomyces osmaniensis]|uniref:Uncharacterized protein n=1 Tax=Streptomyces osmaniensis TaxID=593134 RepID=A0ABP6UXI3_9ACTN